jgi:hypothetical protein
MVLRGVIAGGAGPSMPLKLDLVKPNDRCDGHCSKYPPHNRKSRKKW